MRRVCLWPLLPGVLLALALTSCEGDDSTIVTITERNGHPDGIVGVVRDADGQPVADVAIGLVYMLDGYELPGDWDSPDKPLTDITFEVSQEELVSLVIYDYAGNPVRTLIDETTEEIPDVIIWDGLDEEGQMVPTGLYYARGIFADLTRVELKLFHYDYEIEAFLNKPNAVTGGDGSFQVPRDLIPVGEEIPVSGEEGFLGLGAILPQIMVVAVVEVGLDTHFQTEVVTLTESDPGVTVDFAFDFVQKAPGFGP